MRQFDGHDFGRLAIVEQGVGNGLDGHRGGPFPHSDQHGSVADHVDVAAFDRGRLVGLVLGSIVGQELGVGEEWMEPVDGFGVKRFALAGLSHRFDGHPAVDPARVVTLEEMVGQRGQDEVVGLEHAPLQAVGPRRVQVGFEDAAYEELGQGLGVWSSKSRSTGSTRHGPSSSGVRTRSSTKARPAGTSRVSASSRA
jgi:hypothetical protein